MRTLSFVTPHREDYPHSQCSDVARWAQRAGLNAVEARGSAREQNNEVSYDVQSSSRQQ
jgi:hypothetical protein